MVNQNILSRKDGGETYDCLLESGSMDSIYDAMTGTLHSTRLPNLWANIRNGLEVTDGEDRWPHFIPEFWRLGTVDNTSARVVNNASGG